MTYDDDFDEDDNRPNLDAPELQRLALGGGYDNKESNDNSSQFSETTTSQDRDFAHDVFQFCVSSYAAGPWLVQMGLPTWLL